LQYRASTPGRPERALSSRALLVMLAGLGVACSEAERATDFASLTAPGGRYVLTTAVIAPWFPQGPHQVVVYVQLEAQSPRIELARTSLAYDGVPFTRHNIGMRWTSDDEALVCLRATDRPDKSIHVNMRRQPPSGELQDGC